MKILFSEMDAAASVVAEDFTGFEEKEGLPVEAFAKVKEIFSSVDWSDPNSDAALHLLQQISASNIAQEDSNADLQHRVEISTQKQEMSPRKELASQSMVTHTTVSTVSSEQALTVSAGIELMEPKGGSISPSTPAQPPPLRPAVTSSAVKVFPHPLPTLDLSASESVDHSSIKENETYLESRGKSLSVGLQPTTPTTPPHPPFKEDNSTFKTECPTPPPPPTPPMKEIRTSRAGPSPPPPKPPVKENNTIGAGPPPPPPPPPTPPLKENNTIAAGPPPAPPPPPMPPLKENNKIGVGPPPPPPPPPPLKENLVIGSGPRPPPPPLHSGPTTSLTVSSPMPPAPPPPPIMSTNSSHAPSAPPPPSGKGTLKTGNNRNIKSPGSPSLAPPTPAPPLGSPSISKGRLSRTISSRNNQTKKLKPLHWLKLTRAVQGSLWAEAQKSGEASKYVLLSKHSAIPCSHILLSLICLFFCDLFT